MTIGFRAAMVGVDYSSLQADSRLGLRVGRRLALFDILSHVSTAMLTRDSDIAILSVRPSVRLSHTCIVSK